MRFTVQEVDGRQVLLAEGQIDDDLMPRLEEALRTFDGDEIWLRSPGGNPRVSLEAGRLIRENGFATHISRGSACSSACNFLFMGGVVRTVDNGGYYIIQRFGGTGRPNAIEQRAEDGADLAAEVERQSSLTASVEFDYLIRMGVSTRLLTDIVYRASTTRDGQDGATRRCLTQDELVEYRVVGPPQPVRSR